MKNLIALFLSLVISTAAIAQVEKRVHKSFESVNFTDLKIINSFGDIEVTPQKSSKIDVEIVLTADSKSDKKVQEYLDNTEFIFVENGNTLEISTAKSDKNFKSTGKMSYSLKFTLKVPENLNVDIKNSFGDVRINGTTGLLKLKIQHGDCFIAYANGSDNDLKISFGDVRIESINKSHIVIQHGDLKIIDAHDLNLDSQFGDINIDMLSGDNKFKIAHGDLEVYDVLNNFSSLKIDMQFGDIAIVGFSKHRVDMDLSGTFTKYAFDKNWNLGESTKGINDVHYHVKSSSGTGSIKNLKITASHSNVKLK